MSGTGRPAHDRRVTPARSDLAAARLRGLVEADRFVEGRAARVVAELADLKVRPRSDAGLSTQLLHGEAVTVFDESEGWAWVQAERDGYVGYVAGDALGEPAPANQRVTVNRTFVYPAPDMKRPVLRSLPLDARVAVTGREGLFARLSDGGYVFAAHLAPLAAAADFVAVAERFLGAPYLWGGRSVAGLDCSALVQLAAGMAGVDLPRDTDMQEALADWIEVADGTRLLRGDLVYWRGHVGVLVDPETLLHANGHHMLVVREPLSRARARILDAAGAEVSSFKRPFWQAIEQATET